METLRLGGTGLRPAKTGFGALPIQRIEQVEAIRILRHAVDGGINFFDTARRYTDSEEKIGAALSGVRKDVILASKLALADARSFEEDLHTSLKTLRTDYLDSLQIHNPPHVPTPDDADGCYQVLMKARRAGKIRFIGLTAHAANVAIEAIQSGLYDTVQFPFSCISDGPDLQIPELCREADVGFLAMKALGGGLIKNIPAAFVFMRSHDNVLPLWGIQKTAELEEFLALSAVPPAWDEDMARSVERERAELGASFCRGCGYCLPCMAGIDIPFVARVRLMLGRAPLAKVLNGEGRKKMARAPDCVQCGDCKRRCPYGLDVTGLVRDNSNFFLDFARRNGL